MENSKLLKIMAACGLIMCGLLFATSLYSSQEDVKTQDETTALQSLNDANAIASNMVEIATSTDTDIMHVDENSIHTIEPKEVAKTPTQIAPEISKSETPAQDTPVITQEKTPVQDTPVQDIPAIKTETISANVVNPEVTESHVTHEAKEEHKETVLAENSSATVQPSTLDNLYTAGQRVITNLKDVLRAALTYSEKAYTKICSWWK